MRATISKTSSQSGTGSTLSLELLLHDLSAPTRHLAFFLRQLDESLRQATPDQAECIRLMQENLAMQKTLLRDARLLLAHERQPQVVSQEPVRVTPILEAVAASFGPAFDERGVLLRVELSADPPLLVDPQALARVASNLLGNALKATPRGGLVTLGSQIEGSAVVFHVSDTGGGFTPEQAASLARRLEDFEAGIPPSDLWGGLGLLVCHSIITRYGGQLSMASPGPGLGSTFSFKIPVAAGIASEGVRSIGASEESDVCPPVQTGNRPLREASFYAV